ncbi:MAG TPA: BTAD domain-containing putative transcriptional regulator, partial [Polyangia bacterium]|nr:BTAD domain-containing putative transcriptional regulator [Polyangia bacterium]
MSAKRVEIKLLGELEVSVGGRAQPLPASKKTRALLAYLVATARPHLRERLCLLLWDGPDDPRAALRWSLTKIRPLLDVGAARLAADRERVVFEPGDALVDATLVRRALEGGVEAASTEALRDVAARFRGELLEGLDLPSCYRFHEWCVGEREALRALRVRALAQLCARLDGAPEEALGYARARVLVDPLTEAAHVDVVRLLGRLGRVREAQAQYETCRRILESELGSKTSPALEQARRELGKGSASA